MITRALPAPPAADPPAGTALPASGSRSPRETVSASVPATSPVTKMTRLASAGAAVGERPIERLAVEPRHLQIADHQIERPAPRPSPAPLRRPPHARRRSRHRAARRSPRWPAPPRPRRPAPTRRRRPRRSRSSARRGGAGASSLRAGHRQLDVERRAGAGRDSSRMRPPCSWTIA